MSGRPGKFLPIRHGRIVADSPLNCWRYPRSHFPPCRFPSSLLRRGAIAQFPPLKEGASVKNILMGGMLPGSERRNFTWRQNDKCLAYKGGRLGGKREKYSATGKTLGGNATRKSQERTRDVEIARRKMGGFCGRETMHYA